MELGFLRMWGIRVRVLEMVFNCSGSGKKGRRRSEEKEVNEIDWDRDLTFSGDFHFPEVVWMIFLVCFLREEMLPLLRVKKCRK